MRIVGKAGEKYLCSLCIDEIMAFFPETSTPPVAALKEGEEYDIKAWADKVFQLKLVMKIFTDNVYSIEHHTAQLKEEYEKCFSQDGQ